MAAQTALPTPQYSYADLADRALAAPIALVATVTDTIRLKSEQAPNLAAGHARLFVEATANTLIRGPGDVPPAVQYLADVPLDAKGKVPKLKNRHVLLLARPIAGKPGVLQLISPDAQMMMTPELDKRVRAILTEGVRPDAAPPVTGITSAFHVPGSIPGEGETQIFLATRDNRPISISVLSRPGQDRQWSVALGEVVDEAAQAPQRDTLLWYRLACGLPRQLPAEATADLEAANAEAARGDYAYVLQQLGACTRNVRTS
ncbi:hypothetical protein ACFSCW_04565 [Sphingomonas tabacisoli]|uniref:Uncharacterized protein n=1 Tax=Sphingomonas tabacisoli TaxID=2249466 RepID=A0ABW4I0W1_9SPHN